MEPLLHLVIPVLFLLAVFPKLEKKYIIGLAAFTFIMDFDIFLPLGYHRFIMNNIFFIAAMTSLVWLFWDKKAFFVSLFYMFSHLLFDMGKPGGALLWPIVDKTYYIVAEIFKEGGKFVVNFGVHSLTREEVITLGLNSTQYWMNVEGFLVTILALILICVRYRKEISTEIKQVVSKSS